jgi:peptidoglycan/xylan/chitin deacetylase (PgdA/CDA1 family)
MAARLPVLNVLVRYLLLKPRQRSVCIDGQDVPLSSQEDLDAAVKALVQQVDSLPRARRWERVLEIAASLGIEDVARDVATGMMLVSEDDVARLHAAGVDVQLHTHRHPDWKVVEKPDLLEEELALNREALVRCGCTQLRHFAYPSGYHHERQVPVLQTMGVVSAVTTVAGWNYPGASPYFLKRCLDHTDIPLIRFQAEVAGVSEVFRGITRRLRRGAGVRPAANGAY